MTFDPVNDALSDPRIVATNEVGFTLRYAPNVKFYEGRSSRVPMLNKYPILDISLAVARTQGFHSRVWSDVI